MIDYQTDLIDHAVTSPLKRSFYPLHKEDSDPVQRFYNCMLWGTYVKPHRHAKTETFILLQGEARMLYYDEQGNIDYVLFIGAENQVIEVPANTIHTLYPITRYAIFFIIKPGPYEPEAKIFMDWAPDTWEEFWEEIKDEKRIWEY